MICCKLVLVVGVLLETTKKTWATASKRVSWFVSREGIPQKGNSKWETMF
jgi:hypothetical protein